MEVERLLSVRAQAGNLGSASCVPLSSRYSRVAPGLISALTNHHLPPDRVIHGARKQALEKDMAAHSSILAWRIPWMEEPGRLYSPWGREESDTTERLHFLSLLSYISL